MSQIVFDYRSAHRIHHVYGKRRAVDINRNTGAVGKHDLRKPEPEIYLRLFMFPLRVKCVRKITFEFARRSDPDSYDIFLIKFDVYPSSALRPKIDAVCPRPYSRCYTADLFPRGENISAQKQKRGQQIDRHSARLRPFFLMHKLPAAKPSEIEFYATTVQLWEYFDT